MKKVIYLLLISVIAVFSLANDACEDNTSTNNVPIPNPGFSLVSTLQTGS